MAQKPAKRRPNLRQLFIETIYRFQCPYCGYVKKDSINEIVRRTAEKHLAKEERRRQWREAQDEIVRAKLRGTFTGQSQPHPIDPLVAVATVRSRKKGKHGPNHRSRKRRSGRGEKPHARRG